LAERSKSQEVGPFFLVFSSKLSDGDAAGSVDPALGTVLDADAVVANLDVEESRQLHTKNPARKRKDTRLRRPAGGSDSVYFSINPTGYVATVPGLVNYAAACSILRPEWWASFVNLASNVPMAKTPISTICLKD
jgi:hypothetical protein